MHTVTMTRNGIETVIIENGTFEEAQKALDDYLFGASAVPVTPPDAEAQQELDHQRRPDRHDLRREVAPPVGAASELLVTPFPGTAGVRAAIKPADEALWQGPKPQGRIHIGLTLLAPNRPAPPPAWPTKPR